MNLVDLSAKIKNNCGIICEINIFRDFLKMHQNGPI